MYIAKREFTEKSKKIRTSYYSKQLEASPQYTCSILNGQKNCSGLFARAILSLYYEIPLGDDRMIQLLEENFETVTKEE